MLCLLCDELLRLLIMARKKDPELNAQRRSDILRSAARIFKEKGFHGARTEEICAEAGISPGTLFRHFSDKRALILAMVEIEFEGYTQEVIRLASKEGLYWIMGIGGEELLALIETSEYNLHADSWLELARDPERAPQLLAMDQKLRDILTQRLVQGKVDGWVRASVNAVGAANIILAIFTGLIVDRQQGIRIDADATAQALGDVLKSILV